MKNLECFKILGNRLANGLVGMASISILLFSPCSAKADCDAIKTSLAMKMEKYTRFRIKNEQTLKVLLATEADCKAKGAGFSKAAESASALSCEAQIDMYKVDHKMSELGKKCESNVKKINDFQSTMHSQFDAIKLNLDKGLAAMKKSKLVKTACPGQVKKTMKTVKRFNQLESDIVASMTRSLSDKVSYGKLRDTANELQVAALTAGKNCSGMGALSTSKVKHGTKIEDGEGTVGRNGKASDISGSTKPARETASDPSR